MRKRWSKDSTIVIRLPEVGIGMTLAYFAILCAAMLLGTVRHPASGRLSAKPMLHNPVLLAEGGAHQSA